MPNNHSKHDLGFATVTRKVMQNGEIRTSMALPHGVSTTFTQLGEWDSALGTLPWQNAHFHKGLTEIYTIFEGWMFYVHAVAVQGGGMSLKMGMAMPNECVTFPPGLSHSILLGPCSLIQTSVFGEPIPNAENKGNDWYPDYGLDELTKTRRLFVSFCKEGKALVA